MSARLSHVARLARRWSSRGAQTAPSTSEHVVRGVPRGTPGLDYYAGVAVGVGTIGDRALAPETLDRVLATLDRLDPDDYSAYVRSFVDEARALVGPGWRYADILTVLAAAAELLAPSSYLEIGVRRGRSMAVVGSTAPACSILGIDLWQPGYAGMDNPGPDHVRAELEKIGHEGALELLSGDSHALLPELFSQRPDLSFDLITVDGDHSTTGAAQDLVDVLPRLRIGGAVVFDDVRHPAHPGLNEVWADTVAAERRYATWQFDDVGYGIAVAVRRW